MLWGVVVLGVVLSGVLGLAVRINNYTCEKSEQATVETTTAPSKSSYNGFYYEQELTTSRIFDCDYVVNTNTGKFHRPYCSWADNISSSNRWEYDGSRGNLIEQGYSPCGHCNP